MASIKEIKDKLRSITSSDGIISGAPGIAKYLNDLASIKDQSFSQVVLESTGISIPLPSLKQAYNFYKDYEIIKKLITEEQEPTNKLAYIDPEDWSESDYLKYQSNVKEYQVLESFVNAKTLGAKNIRKLKKKKKEEDKKKKTAIELWNEFLAELNENLPKQITDDQKAKGIQTLPELFWAIVKLLAKTQLPALVELTKQSGLDVIERKTNELLVELGIDDINQVDPEELRKKLCPTNAELDSIITKRNNMVDFLNKQQEQINSLKIPLDGAGAVATFLQTTSNVIKATTLIATAVQNALPAVLPRVVLAIQTLDAFRQTLVQKNDGSSRITPIKKAIGNVNIPLNQLSSLITKIVLQLGQIDDLILICRPSAEITPLSASVLTTVAIEIAGEGTDEGNLYKGFRLEIETKPYTDTVNQNRGIAKNQSGIIMVSTDYSFASNPNILLNELKFTIDKDNLKAY